MFYAKRKIFAAVENRRIAFIYKQSAVKLKNVNNNRYKRF